MKIFLLILFYRYTSGVGHNEIGLDQPPNCANQISNNLKRSLSTLCDSDFTSCKKERLIDKIPLNSEVSQCILDKDKEFFKLIVNLVTAILYHRNELDLMVQSLNLKTIPISKKSADTAAFIDIALGFFDKSSIPQLTAEYAKEKKQIKLVRSEKVNCLKPKKTLENNYERQLLAERLKTQKKKQSLAPFHLFL